MGRAPSPPVTGSVPPMVSARRVTDSALVVLCYVLWTGVLLGVAGVGALWVVGELRGDAASSSSTYRLFEDNAPLLLGGSAVLALLAGALSFWVDRRVD
jgi:hypothetical protein